MSDEATILTDEKNVEFRRESSQTSNEESVVEAGDVEKDQDVEKETEISRSSPVEGNSDEPVVTEDNTQLHSSSKIGVSTDLDKQDSQKSSISGDDQSTEPQKGGVTSVQGGEELQIGVSASSTNVADTESRSEGANQDMDVLSLQRISSIADSSAVTDSQLIDRIYFKRRDSPESSNGSSSSGDSVETVIGVRQSSVESGVAGDISSSLDSQEGPSPPSSNTGDSRKGAVPVSSNTGDSRKGAVPVSSNTGDSQIGPIAPSSNTRDSEKGAIPRRSTTAVSQKGAIPRSSTTFSQKEAIPRSSTTAVSQKGAIPRSSTTAVLQKRAIPRSSTTRYTQLGAVPSSSDTKDSQETVAVGDLGGRLQESGAVGDISSSTTPPCPFISSLPPIPPGRLPWDYDSGDTPPADDTISLDYNSRAPIRLSAENPRRYDRCCSRCCCVCDYLRPCCRRIRKSKIFKFIRIALLILPIVYMSFGLYYMDGCPVQSKLSVLMIVSGIVGLILLVSSLLIDERRFICPNVWKEVLTLGMIVGRIIFLAIFAAVLNATYSISPSFDHGSEIYCDKTFYSFTYYANFVVCGIVILAFLLYVPGINDNADYERF